MNARCVSGSIVIAICSTIFIPLQASALCMKYPVPAENRSGAIGEILDERGQPASLGGRSTHAFQTIGPIPRPAR